MAKLIFNLASVPTGTPETGTAWLYPDADGNMILKKDDDSFITLADVETLEDYLPLAGGSVSGNITMTGGAKVTGLPTPSSSTDAASKSYVDSAVSGLLDFKGSLDASTNPNYPSASAGDAYLITVAGKVGGASGEDVEVGDVVVASADNAGGTEASVGTSWFVMQANGVYAPTATVNGWFADPSTNASFSVSAWRIDLGIPTSTTDNTLPRFDGTSGAMQTSSVVVSDTNQLSGVTVYVTNGLGSAGAPAYTFGGDTDTGIYSSGADIINFATGGTSRLQITAGGNLVATGTVSAGASGFQSTVSGSAATPSFGYSGFSESIGMYRVAASELGLASNSTQRCGVDATGFYFGPTATKLRITPLGAGTISLPATTGTVTVGPTSTTDNTIARYDGTTGALQGSGIFVSDLWAITGASLYGVNALGTATNPVFYRSNRSEGMWFPGEGEIGFSVGTSNTTGVGVQKFGADGTGFYIGPTATKYRLAVPASAQTATFPTATGTVAFTNTINGVTFDGLSAINVPTYTDRTTGSTSFTAGTGVNTFTGSTASQTVTLPAPTARAPILFKNQSSVSVTLASASGSQIYTTSAQASITVVAGDSVTLWPDGTYWNQ